MRGPLNRVHLKVTVIVGDSKEISTYNAVLSEPARAERVGSQGLASPCYAMP